MKKLIQSLFLFALGLLTVRASAQSINIDVKTASDTAYSGSTGALSTTGTFWNNSATDWLDLKDEFGASSGASLIMKQFTGSVTTTSGGSIFYKGLTVSSSAAMIYDIVGLEAHKSYDVVIYFQSSALGRGYVTDAGGLHTDTTTLSNNRQLPGTEKGEYVRFRTMEPYEISSGLYGLKIYAYGQSSFSYDALVGLQVRATGNIANVAPHLPSIISPSSAEADVALPVTLTASAFSDPDAGDTHGNTRWVVDNNSDFSSPEFDSTDSGAAGTSITVPVGTLSAGTLYYWRVRYKDAGGKWSPYASSTFLTANASGLSNNARLGSLSLSAGTLSPLFAATTISYTASVSNGTTSISVTPTREQANATIQARINFGSYATVTSGSASATLNLNVGANTLDVRVTAQDGVTTKTYTITVTRLGSPIADLSNLTVSSGTLNPVFSPTITSYNASVPTSTASITVTPTKAQANATIQVRINGGSYATVSSGSASAALALNAGNNTIDVRVTAQDTSVTRTYTISVLRGDAPVAPSILSATFSGHQFTIQLGGTTNGKSYRIERSDNLSGWTALTTVQATGITLDYSDTVAPPLHAFYRVVALP